MSVLRIGRESYAAICEHGEETYPLECCGALLGRETGDGWWIETPVRTENASVNSTRNHYSIAPVELVKIERDARRQGLSIAGFYHSHPDHSARWSPTDLAEAHWLGCSYVITAVAEGKATETKSFLLTGATEGDKQFQMEVLEIVEMAESRDFSGADQTS